VCKKVRGVGIVDGSEGVGQCGEGSGSWDIFGRWDCGVKEK